MAEKGGGLSLCLAIIVIKSCHHLPPFYCNPLQKPAKSTLSKTVNFTDNALLLQ